MPIATTGANTTGEAGLVAVDKVGNKVRFYDPRSLTEISSVEGPEPCVHELAISPDHSRGFVPLYGDGIYGANRAPNNKVLVLDLAARASMGLIDLGANIAPHGMVATANDRLWVVCDIPRKLLLIDTERRVIEAAYDCPSKGPHLLASSADGATLYISAKEGDISVFDTATRVFAVAIPVRASGVESGNGSGSEGITLSPDGRSLIAVDNSNGDLRVFDSLTNREIDRVPMTMQTLSNQKRSRLGKLMYSPDGRHLVVTGYAGGCAWLVDPNDLRRQTPVPVAKGPMGTAFTPDGGSVIVSSHDNGLLTRIDLEKQTPVTAYDGGAGIEVLTFY